MLAFIVPVRHPANAKSYPEIETLLRETLASLTATRDAPYRVVVVCSQALEGYEHPDVDFHVVGFPPPGQGKGSGQTIEDFRKDKSTKVLAGILKAQEAGATAIMNVDADDFVHRDLAAFWDKERGNGYFVEEGMTWRHGGALVADRPEFYQVCGTSNIISMKCIEPYLDASLTPHSEQDAILANTDEAFLHQVLGSHRPVPGFFEDQGQPFTAVPFKAAVWRTGSGESHSGIRFADAPRVASREDIADFGLPITQGTRSAALLTEWPIYTAKHIAKQLLRR